MIVDNFWLAVEKIACLLIRFSISIFLNEIDTEINN